MSGAPDPVVAAAAVATVPGPRPAWLPAAKARRLDPLAALVCTAVAGLGDGWDPDCAVAVGSAWGSTASTTAFADGLRTHGERGGGPAAFASSIHHHPAAALGELLGLHGPVATLCMEDASGLAALRWAWLQLRAGRADEVLVVAADAPDPWTRGMVAGLRPGAAPVGQGAVALRLRRGGPGRRFRFLPPGPAAPAPASDAWWPTDRLAAAPWHADGGFAVTEAAGAARMAAWFDPSSPA
jgi:hypothetical protein